jgi:hypothetical protein
MITSVRERCIICARQGPNGGLCGYCEKFHLPYPDSIDPKAECSVCFKIFSLFSCRIIGDTGVVLCATCYKNDRSLHRQKSIDSMADPQEH